MNDIIESANYKKAVALTQSIKVNAKLAEQSLYEVCRSLKEVHDDKLYKELGYETFESYSEDELNIKRHMAYKYVTVAGIENVESIQHLGITKLSLLAKLDEPVREEIQQNTDLESTSVKELKAKIKALEKEQEESAEENLRSTLILKKEKAVLEKKIEELENRPVEVAVQESHEAENLRKAMQKVDMDWAEKYDKLEEENLKKTRIIMQNNQEHSAEIERIKAEYEKKLSESKPDTVTDDKAVFKAYLSNAVDASKRLIEFISQHPDNFYKDKTRELLENLISGIN